MTVQIGLLGTGFIAGVHTKNCKKRDDCQIVAVADCSLGLAAEFCKKNDLIATPYGDFGEMVKKEKLDAIVFCIPPFAHNGYVEETARQGIHCFIEKPIAISSSKAKVMVDAVAEAGIISQVGFHYRFKKSVRKVKELICSGDAGVPLLFTGRYWTNSSGSTWWRNKEKSGGQIFEQTCHMYDLGPSLFR
jgi:predicted dehydrogenase